MLSRDQTVLLVVDAQEKLMKVMPDAETMTANLRTLIQGAQLMDIPIIWTEQVPEKLGPTIPEVAELLAGQTPIEKAAFSCCLCEAFNQRLEELDRTQVLIAGIETHICVYQTVMHLLALNEIVFDYDEVGISEADLEPEYIDTELAGSDLGEDADWANWSDAPLAPPLWEVQVVGDACTTRKPANHPHGLDRIQAEGAAVTAVEMALFELMATSEDPNFKALSQLVR